MLDYQGMLYGPIYDQFGQPATINTTGGDSINVVAQNKTKPSTFPGIVGTVEFQAFRPTARVRMSEILAAGLSVPDDVSGGELVMSGKTWSIKSFEYIADAVSNEDGEVELILSDDVDV